MENITSIISEVLYMEVDQIISVKYRTSNEFTISDNCGDSYTITVVKN